MTVLLVATCHKASAQANCNFFVDQFFGYTCELHDAIVEEDNFNLVINTDNHASGSTDASVTSLTVGNNTALRFFPSSILAQFPNLRYLILENAGIENLTPGSFSGCNNVVIIHIRHNSFPTVPAGLFDDCENLGVLDLTDNGINEVHEDAFENIPTILELDLIRNNLTRIQSGLLRNLVNLEELNLHQNRISEIGVGAFSTLSSLNTFYLRNNQITTITADMFGDRINMVYFNVNSNLLTRVPQLPENAPRIHYVHMADNQISEIAEGDFTFSHHNITNIDLTGNRLTELRGDPFVVLENLDILTVTNNRIESVDHEFFDKVPSLYTFYFDGNMCANARFDNIRSRDQTEVIQSTFDRCFYNSFEPETTHTCTFVQDVNLGYTCEVSDITFQTFRDKFTFTGNHLATELDNSHVTGLRIVNSNFARVPPSIFAIFPNLHFFSLTDSDFSVIEENTFERCGDLRWIDLSRNRVQRLSRHSFHNCVHLTELILDDNRIAEIEPCNSFILNIYQAQMLSMRRNICIDQVFQTSGRLFDEYERIVSQYLSRCYSLWYMFLDTPAGASARASQKATCSLKR